MSRYASKRRALAAAWTVPLTALGLLASSGAQAQVSCGADNTVVANVVALDTLMVHNRLGAQNPNWMMYALRRDVVDNTTGLPEAAGGTLSPGNVSIRPDKRPRPLALRVPAGQCLQVNFQNLLAPRANPNNAAQADLQVNDQVRSRFVGVQILGMQLVNGIEDDASFVGRNPNSTVPPGGSATYTWYAEHEGGFLISNPSAAVGGQATGGNMGIGMFGLAAVEPAGARVYRGQVYEEELRLAGDADLDGLVDAMTPQGHPVIDYEATYPAQEPWISEGKAGLPILNMICEPAIHGATACPDGRELVHSDINGIVAGPNADGSFPPETYPLESAGLRNPTVPNRLEAFREFVSIFHGDAAVAQAFQGFYDDPVLGHTLSGVADNFMINYASGGIGSEILANRLGVGPMYDCLGCAYEEFFLSSFTVGDPGMIVDVPANMGLEHVTPGQVAAQDPGLLPFIGPKATTALYQDDPASIHNSYTGDFAKFRSIHAGPKEQHIFHLHNHQWLFSANDDRSNYLDAQGIGPGSSYTYEIAFGGSGNRNKTAGDAIYHCHFYPHFAQGMWYHWRVHDVAETGTVLEASLDGGAHPRYHDVPFALGASRPALVTATNAAGLSDIDLAGLDPLTTRYRAHPDGEILAGVPITATVPLPGKAMPPMPGDVVLVTKNVDPGKDNDPVTPGIQDLDDSSQVHVVDRDVNPGYPFWIAGVDCGGDPAGCEAGIVGQRPPTPPLDMASEAEAADLLASDPFYREMAAADPAWATAFVNAAGGFDGGLPRHSIDGCKAAGTAEAGAEVFSCTNAPALHDVAPLYVSAETRLDLHKEVLRAKGVIFPEGGTDLEKVAMAAHATRRHPSTKLNLDGTLAPEDYVLNGAKPVPGAPFADPCIDDQGNPLIGGGTGQFFAAGQPGSGSEFFTGPIPDARSWENPFVYAGANIQIDAVFNKAGYHYPQQRIIALWGDVLPIINKERPPEPFVMRLNSFDCAKYRHTNLVPKEYEVDDYQVRTPTDIIGQHIHLPKWDLVSADGAANGWNYEDGTLAPGMVRERIEAINAFNDLAAPGTPHYEPEPHPALGAGVGGEWLGARVTLQRWFVDPVVDRDTIDRGLGVIFTHDHYGPSTHQQIGLYATLLAEPAQSVWVHNETGERLGSNIDRVGPAGTPVVDGGPTSWQAAIIPGDLGEEFETLNKGQEAFREFYFEFSDFQHAYEAGVYVGAGPDGRPHTGAGAASHDANGVNVAYPVTADTFRNAINPSYKQEASPVFPDIVRYPPVCPGGVPRPCPEAVDADDVGMFVTNYRNEPVGLRVFDPDKLGPDGRPGTQADGQAGDLAFALQSRTDRACEALNVQPQAGDVAEPCVPIFETGTLLPTTYPPQLNASSDVKPGDPFTPMVRAMDGDLVKIKVQAGGHEHEHNVAIDGVKWVQGNSGFGPDRPTGGWRAAQNTGISEQFNFSTPVLADTRQTGNRADYSYVFNAGQDGWWTGTWGLIRSYRSERQDLYRLPGTDLKTTIVNRDQFEEVCPVDAPKRVYEVTAVLANDVLGNALGATLTGGLPDRADLMHEGGALDPSGGTLVYNPREAVIPADPSVSAPQREGPLHDPTAILYVRTDDLVDPANPKAGLEPGAPVEPVVLRAAAGDCIEVTLTNALPPLRDVQVGTDELGNPIVVQNSTAPDLAGYNTLLQMVVRDRAVNMQNQLSMTTFNNNLVRPSSWVGLNAQLVEKDITRSAGRVIGLNPAGQSVAAPGGKVTYQWYAGDIRGVESVVGFGGRNGDKNQRKEITLVATPVELGGGNLLPADTIKQGQKGAIGALVVEPAGASWDDSLASLQRVRDRQQGDATLTTGTRADTTVTLAGGGSFEDLVVVAQKGMNHRFRSGEAVPNIPAEGPGVPEDSNDAGQKGLNYGSEPAWFRFGVQPTRSFGNGPGSLGAVDGELMFSNTLVGEDPATAVYTAPPGQEARFRVLMPTGVGRGSTFVVHGHVWARDPYLPENPLCVLDPTGVEDCGLSSTSIGENPLAWYMNGIESWHPASHYDVVLPEAGGVNAVTGDYLFRDMGSFGLTDGIWGLFRVE